MEYYVYILKSKKKSNQFYIAYTSDLKNRMQDHEDPKATAYTRQYAPWGLETYITFKNKILAQQFELYLKSHSGRAFLRKRLIT